jgi:hypothetical protein
MSSKNKHYMKRIIIIAMILAVGFVTKAQDTTAHKMHHQMKDCVMMKNGNLLQMKDGKTMDFSQDITLTDGTTIMKDGTVKKKDGTTVTLKEGDCIMMDGTVKHMGMKKKKDM